MTQTMTIAQLLVQKLALAGVQSRDLKRNS